MYGAGAALRDSAAELRASHAEDVSKHPEQRHVIGGVTETLLPLTVRLTIADSSLFREPKSHGLRTNDFLPPWRICRQGIGDTPPQDPCLFADQAGLYAEAWIRLSAQLVMSAMGH